MCCIRKDLLKTKHFPGLMLCTASNITARIPLQSAARTSHADSFSPGEAIGAAAPLDKVNNNLRQHSFITQKTATKCGGFCMYEI